MSVTSIVRTGPLTINLEQRRVWDRGAEINLSPREWGLLAYLAERVGRNCPVIEIVAAVWGEAWAIPIRSRSGGTVHYAHTTMLRESCRRLRRRLGAAGSLIVSGPAGTPCPWRRLDAVEPTT